MRHERLLDAERVALTMNKRLKRHLAAFQRIVARPASVKYHVSQYTIHEQAIREHIQRGFADGLDRVPGLLNQANKIC